MIQSKSRLDDKPKRAVSRLVAKEFIDGFAALADLYGLDLLTTLVFTGVWTANTEHLNESDRYATVYDLPPNMVRRPIGEAELARRLRLPEAMVWNALDDLAAMHLVERTSSGAVVPTAVFTSAPMIEGINRTYESTQALVQRLAELMRAKEPKA